MDALTIVLTVGALVLAGFIYSRTRNGCLSWVGFIGLAFIVGGVWNLAVGKEVGWSQIGIGAGGVLILWGLLREYTGGGKARKVWQRKQEAYL